MRSTISTTQRQSSRRSSNRRLAGFDSDRILLRPAREKD
jgi:hypothetical protein